MATKTLLPPTSSSSSSLITDRYFFRSHSNDPRGSSSSSSLPKKHDRFSPKTKDQYPNIYKFPTAQNDQRSHSSESTRYYFSLENTSRNLQQTLTNARSTQRPEPRSVTFIEGSSTFLSDAPYLFSATSKSQKYPHPEDTWTYRRQQPPRILERDVDTSLRVRSISPTQPRSTRMDTVTSTNGLLSLIKRSPTDKSPTVHFESSLLSSSVRSYLNEARVRLSGRRGSQSSESFEKSVDRLVSSVNKNYGQHPSKTSYSTSSSSNYVSQYYAKEDERSFDSNDEQQQRFSVHLNINRTHTQIMKTLNRSLIDRSYQGDRNRLKHLTQNVQRYLRSLEHQTLQRELNYDLIRCFSYSYLHDVRQEEFRLEQMRSELHSYTYEDIQDIHVPSILEVYKMRRLVDRERQQRLQFSISTGQLSPASSSGYSPIMIGSLNEHMDTQSRGFETDHRSMTSISQISPSLRPNVDVFYEIMQESFRGVDASIAGHISKASQLTKSRHAANMRIRSTTSLWSDEELADPYLRENKTRKSIPNQGKIARYVSALNRSLLDRPSDLITDFYLSQLNLSMQESVRNVENIARDKADEQEFLDHRTNQLSRSLSAEHLYQVRKEHHRYKQTSTRSTSFTTEDVADIYKPFVLENYKRKIAIELERRRRERQEHLISKSETDLTYCSNRSLPPPRTRHDYPPVIVQTREIIMGRARRTVTHDGASDIIHHIGGISPPAIYSVDKQPSSSPRINTRLITTVDPPDFVPQHSQDEIRRSHAQIYIHRPLTKTIRICHANRIESDSESLSMVNIEPIQSLNQYEIHSLNDSSSDGRTMPYIEQKPTPQQSTLVLPFDEHVPTIHENIAIIEILLSTNLLRPPTHQAHEISADSGVSLNISQPNEPPMIFNSPYIQFTTEPLPEVEGTIITNEIPLASLLEEISSARQIIDDYDYWKTCEKVEENARIAIIVDHIEWTDENVEEFSLNIQNAQYKYPEDIQYEHIQINRPIIENDEQIIQLPEDSFLIRYQQQLHLDGLPDLENPIHSTHLQTFNYPQHNQNHRSHSQTSSYLEMETFLNNFEESIDHEQHLPFVNQISLSYATLINERNQTNYRPLPSEWYQPPPPHDEQLVEQWTVENNHATIQQEGTLHRHQVDFLTQTNIAFASPPDACRLNDELSTNSILRENHDLISHCSPTSDYETDSVEKDNDTLIIPLTILPSSSITNPTLLSQSSSLLTSYTAPIAPIVYFLDVLAHEQKEIKTSAKDFLLTIGFGQNPMNEITNTVATTEQSRRPIWINRSLSESMEVLPTSIHQESLSMNSSIHQSLHFAIENQVEEENTALVIHSHRFQYGHDLGENTQAPLNPSFVPSFLHLPMTNETYKYQMNSEFPFFYPSDTRPQILPSKIQANNILSPDEYQPEIYAYAQINYIPDNHHEETQPISIKFEQPTYIEHYHVQSLHPFPETCYANIDQTEILADELLSNFILMKPEDNDFLSRFKPTTSDTNLIKSIEEVRPSVSPDSGTIYEGVKIHQHVDANMGSKGRYEQRANYTYENEDDRSPRQSKYTRFERTGDSQREEAYVPEKIIEHMSEDEKSTSSEEVVFEEWTEEFKCRRTDEYDRRTNQLLRTTIDETSGRKKGDVIKEQYKEKNTRIKGRKSYDVVKEVQRRTPQYTDEEISPRPPPSSSLILPRSSSTNRQWTSEDIYTTEIVQDPRIARELESTAQKFDSLTHYDRVRSTETSPIQPSSRYDHISTVTTPSTHYADTRKQESEEEEVVTEEYHVEVETPIKQDQTSDWRSKLKQIYNPTTDDDDQHRTPTSGNYLAQRASVIPSTTQQRFKQVQIRVPGHDRTPSERQKFEPLPPGRHTVKEVLISVPRGPLTKDNEQERKRSGFGYSESPRKTDDNRPRSPSTAREHRTSYEPTYSRVGELKNTFETTSTTDRSIKDEYKTPISTGLTDQRRRIFEDQDWTRRSVSDAKMLWINDRRMSETHTAPSLVSDRISRFENTQSIDQHDRKGFGTTFTSKQVISSIDSDLSGPTQPIYQSTPKSLKQKQNEDAGHESEDELSDPKLRYDTRRRTSKTRLRDFSQSTSQPIDVSHTIHRASSNFDETNMENVLSHVPTSKGKGMLIELSPQSPGKSHLTSDSGVFDYSTTTTTYQFPTGSPYSRRRTSEGDQTTLQNVDDSISRSTYRHERETLPTQQQQQQQHRTVRRQLTHSPPNDYENLTSYQTRIDTHGKVPITTHSRSIKPLVVDEYETFETETQVECQVQRTNEMKESTKTERITSPISPSRKIFTTTTHSSIETTPARRVLVDDRPQYYESPKDERRFQPIQRDHSPDELPYRPSSRARTMEVTSLSPNTQVTFEKHSPNQIVAVVRVPELSTSTTRPGTSEFRVYEKADQERTPRLHYQRVHAGSYRPPLLPPTYQQRPSRSRQGPLEHANDYSSPITIPVRSASYHSNSHEQNQQPPPPSRPQTRYHSGSLGNLFGSNLEFEIEIEKRPPHTPEQPTSVSLDQASRAIVTTSKDGRVSVQNIAAYPGNTVVINSDFHASDRSLNRSSGYFSSDEPRSQGHNTNYSSDELSSGSRRVKTNEQIPIRNSSRYHFDQVNEIVQNYSQPSGNFNEAIDQIDALYNNLDVQSNEQQQQQTYDFSRMNRRKQLTSNPNEYSNRFTSTGFQQTSPNQQTSSVSSNLVAATPIRSSTSLSSSGILADYGSPSFSYGSTQNLIVQQNRSNGQSQIVQRNRTSVKQMKQKSEAKRRNGNTQGQYSDEDDENDSPLSDNGRSQSSPRYYNSHHHYQ